MAFVPKTHADTKTKSTNHDENDEDPGMLSPCEVVYTSVQCEKRPRTENAPWPSSWSSGEAPTANLIAKAAKSMDTFDLVSKERVDTLRPGV